MEEKGRSHEGCVRNAQCEYLRGPDTLYYMKGMQRDWLAFVGDVRPPFLLSFSLSAINIFCKVKNGTLC